ncbi:winged helix-turn-helix domain-containing protein [Roseibium suaedae]|uniref:MarR family transcriptional regulator n=1 Tax=Roseibium suaedae TaxID=735517 RepID=A0A1M7PM21_9HYPH|nr:winged helix-turn-helix domain-containing protein [Roseibium suaedae]SHN18343.1 hypothetical protein SAMN05444272_4506 [Roseibium suaedae]
MVDADQSGTWVTIAELGRLHGVSKQAVSKRVRRLEADGKIQVRQEGQSRLVNAAQFARLVADTTDPAQSLRNCSAPVLYDQSAPDLLTDIPPDASASASASGGGQRISYNDAKARRAAIDAEIADLNLKERQGELVSKREAEDRTFELLRRVRDRIMSLPRTISDRIAAAPDARAVRIILDDELRSAFESAADEFEKEMEEDAASGE